MGRGCRRTGARAQRRQVGDGVTATEVVVTVLRMVTVTEVTGTKATEVEIAAMTGVVVGIMEVTATMVTVLRMVTATEVVVAGAPLDPVAPFPTVRSCPASATRPARMPPLRLV